MLSATTTQMSSLSVAEVSRTFGNGRVSEFCAMPTEWCVNGNGPTLPTRPGHQEWARPPWTENSAGRRPNCRLEGSGSHLVLFQFAEGEGASERRAAGRWPAHTWPA